MNRSLINKNQVRELNITVHDNPFDATVFGIEVEISYTLFTSKGAAIIFESQVPTEWEEQKLPVIFLTRYQWDYINVELGETTRNRHIKDH